MKNIVIRMINLFEHEAGKKPEKINIGYNDFDRFMEENDYNNREAIIINDVLIRKSRYNPRGIEVVSYSSSDFAYTEILSEMAKYELAHGQEPNIIYLSEWFHDTYRLDIFKEDGLCTLFNCTISVMPDQQEDVLCEYDEELADVSDRIKYLLKFIPQDDGEKDRSFLFSDQKTELTDDEVKEIEKEVFLDWLMLDNRDEELEEAAEEAAKHDKEIDDFVDYIVKEKQFKEWLRQREQENKQDKREPEEGEAFFGYY